jgi:hypothetical protein
MPKLHLTDKEVGMFTAAEHAKHSASVHDFHHVLIQMFFIEHAQVDLVCILSTEMHIIGPVSIFGL